MSDTAIVGENVEIIQTQARGSRSAFTWSVVIAGALAAWAVAFILISLGTGVGLSIASPYGGPSAGALGIAGAIWLIFVQTAAFATGGYLAARLRIRDHIPGPETKFRDGAHGFMAWVVGASFMAIAIFVAGAFSARTAADAAGSAAGTGVAMIAVGGDSSASPIDYYVDRLFRTDPRKAMTTSNATPSAASAPTPFAEAAPPSGNVATGAPATSGAPAAGGTAARPTIVSVPQTGGLPPFRRIQAERSEAQRILAASIQGDKMDDGDRQYLAQLVAARTGISEQDASRRVTEVQEQAAAKFKQTAETARKAGAYFSFWSFMALLFGAVAATLAGILGGELRDEF